MTPERWQHVYSLFELALDVPPETRGSWLRERSSHDPETLEEVFRLLELGQSSGSFLATSAPTLLGLRGDVRAVFDPGDLIANRYLIRRLIGKGGMGEVYEAFDQELKVDIALKSVHLRRLDDPTAQERLRQEALLAREITHPNVCRIHDLSRHTLDARFGEVLVLAMEFLNGETLAEFLATSTPMSEPEALEIALQICAGLDAAHARGIIHRDLKPANIILVREPHGLRAVITDFGLSRRQAGLDGKQSEMSIHTLFGTPDYMAPESIAGARASVAADIYALGVILFEVATGRKPYPPAGSLKDLLSRHDGPVPALKATNTAFSRYWDATVRACLDRDPARRPVNGAQVAGMLRGTIRASNSRLSRRNALLIAAGLTGSSAIGVGLWQSRKVPVFLFPIENRSGDSALNYLCSGLTAELLRELKACRSIRILSPPGPNRDQAQGLPAHLSLSGAIQLDRSIILVLKDLTSGSVVWTERIPGETQLVPARLNERVVQSALGGITHTRSFPLRTAAVFASDSTPATVAVTTSPEALEDYFRGLFLLRSRVLDDTLAAKSHLEKAISRDPHFALAYAAMAEAQIGLMEASHRSTAELMLAGHSFADRAVREGPRFTESHLVLAAFRQMSWDWDGARASYSEVFRLQPDSSRGQAWYAGLLLQFGTSQDVLTLSRRAFELDPFDHLIRNSHAICLFFCGQYDEAIRLQEDALRMSSSSVAHHQLGNIHAHLGSLSSGSIRSKHFQMAFNHAAAVEQSESSSASVAQAGMRNSDRMLSLFHALAGNTSEAFKFIARLESKLDDGRMSPAAIARAYAALGQQDKAMDLIEMSMGRKDRVLMYIRTNPFFRTLGSNPRYQAVLRTMQV